jgi:FMN phosphatase YigB (HAD superfamily)
MIKGVLLTGNQLLAAVHAQLKWYCTLAELGAAWAAAFAPDKSVLNVARRLVVPAVAFTNNGPPLNDHYRELMPAVAEVVPIAVFSGHTRLVNPDALSFVNACAVLNAVPSDVLLVDDSETNVAAASGAGLRTHHFRNAEGRETFLDREHLLDSRPAHA